MIATMRMHMPCPISLLLVLLLALLLSPPHPALAQFDGGGLDFLSGMGSLSCMQKLMPCQPYLHHPEPPPPSCCDPLKEMLSDPECLCNILHNTGLLKSFNVTQEDLLHLPKQCGSEDLDDSICAKAPSSAEEHGMGQSASATHSDASSSGDSSGKQGSASKGPSLSPTGQVRSILLAAALLFIVAVFQNS